MRLKRPVVHAFRTGMADGVHRLFNEPPEMLAARQGYVNKMEHAAFVAGYELTNKSDTYFYAWKGGKDLLNLAITMKDVLPVGWVYEWSIGGQYYVEEL